MTPAIRMNHVIEEVAETWNVDAADMIGRRMLAEHVWPRHLAMFLTRFATALSFAQIGRRFDHRDHSTVLSAYRKIERELLNDVALQAAVIALASRIRARADREASGHG